MAQTMKIDRAHARCGDVKLQLLVEPIGRDRRAIRADHIDLIRAGDQGGSLLEQLLFFQQFQQARRDRQIPATGGGFGRRVDQTPADALPLVPDPEHAGSQIDIGPSKPGELSAAEAAA